MISMETLTPVHRCALRVLTHQIRGADAMCDRALRMIHIIRREMRDPSMSDTAWALRRLELEHQQGMYLMFRKHRLNALCAAQRFHGKADK